MRAIDKKRWRSARTLADLGELTALWLEGEIGETPGHGGPPDPETVSLVAVLAAVNRSGFVTTHSQPGVPRDENGLEQRADVTGFASGATFARLMTAAAEADLVISSARGLDESWGTLLDITRVDGEECTWDGGSLPHDELQHYYGWVCHPDAIRALSSAWQVTVIDPVWGRDDQLWPLLAEFAAGGVPLT